MHDTRLSNDDVERDLMNNHLSIVVGWTYSDIKKIFGLDEEDIPRSRNMFLD